ncbi:YoaK family protein [Labilibacter marinus]|uniref:YoaK family protein n=1 Tax=Labilibacter marinus TaxID=1477105 RepID=UPI00094FCD01|nr:YoaK family protein [Labilibacter marinus]
MFKHQGKSRTLKHNLRIAILLSFVAGMVNITGYLAFTQLTTNVTGHFALFINDVTHFNFWKGSIYFLYIFSFLLGSFISSMLIEKFKESNKLNVFVLPTILESMILLLTPAISSYFQYPNFIICLLLLAMGLQNSFVTKISDTVVRTTHLTGLFTDLGIEISQLFFPKAHPYKDKIKATIKLRIYIVCFFFAGGAIGAYLYSGLQLKLNTLIISAIILLIGLLLDDLRYRIIRTTRKYKQKVSTQG